MAFTNPKENLAELQLDDGMVVADLGSGSGTYVFLAAKEVGDGRVYAIDVQRELLDKLKKDALEKGLNNIEIIWSDLEKNESTGLKDESVDALIISNVLYLIEDKNIFVNEAKRILRSGGKALIVDWTDSFHNLGPQTEYIVREGDAQKLFKDNGFEIEKVLFNAGENHYGFVARKK